MATAIDRGARRDPTAAAIWWAARTHRVALHRGLVRGMVSGALLIAGFFTFPFGRLLGTWLFA